MFRHDSTLQTLRLLGPSRDIRSYVFLEVLGRGSGIEASGSWAKGVFAGSVGLTIEVNNGGSGDVSMGL